MIFLVLVTMLAQGARSEVVSPLPPPVATGPKGSIQGTVVNEVTGAPVKKSKVMLNRMDGAAQPGNALSGASGGFSFSDLPAGKYQLRADHPDYRGSAAERAGRNGVEVTLQPGDDKTGVAIAITPSAAVSGKVLDEDGDPVSGCQVEAMRYQWQGDRKTLAAEGNVSTNDKGEYRIYNLEAGRYFLRVSSRERIQQPHALMQAKDVQKLPELGYATVFYPGAAEVSGAARLNVAAGAELRGIDLRLPKMRMYPVRGNVEGPPELFSAGKRGMLRLFLADSNEVGEDRAAVEQDGSFVLGLVRPGAYVLDAEYYAGYWGRQEVAVGDAAVEGVTVRLQPAMEIAGKIEIEPGADGSVAKPQGRMTLQLVRKSAAPYFGIQPQPTMVADDGTFAIPGLSPDTYELSLFGQPQPSYIKSLRFGDRDIQGRKISISAGAAGPLKILLGTKMGTVDGTVVRTNETAIVFFFPEAGGTMANQIVADPQGHFHLDGAAPGEYRVFALEGEDGNILQQRGDVRKALEGRSEKVKVEEGGTATVSLTVISREMLERVREENE